MDEPESSLDDGSSFWERNCDATWTFIHENCRLPSFLPGVSLVSIITVYHGVDGDGLDLFETQRVCAATIHFEGILNSILDVARLQSRDPSPDKPRRSPAEAIARVQSFESAKDALDFMKEGQPGGWGLHLTLAHRHMWTNHRQRQTCTTPEAVIRHANVVLSFVRGALRCRDIPSVLKYPADIHGLRSFMSGRPSNPIGGP